ncbi:hypothetical protein AB5I83_17890 [Mesobacillus sp. LC4]
MKKIVSMILSFALLISVFAPLSKVQAEENSRERIPAPAETPTYENIETEVLTDNATMNIMKVTYEENGERKTSISRYNKKTGDAYFDGKLVATIKEKEGTDQSEQGTVILEDDPNVIMPYYSKYTIGPSDVGSGMYVHSYSRNMKIHVYSLATQLAIASALAQSFLERKPDVKAAALIGAAAGLIALTFGSYTYDLTYKHYYDYSKKYWYMDKLFVYKNGAIQMEIRHFFGKL